MPACSASRAADYHRLPSRKLDGPGTTSGLRLAAFTPTCICAGYYATAKAPPALPGFQFHGQRARIDWRTLHGIDLDEVVC